MGAVSEAAVELEDALKTVPEMPIYRDPGAAVDPPAIVLGPPNLTWDMLDTDPSRAQFIVWVVVPFDDRALELLWNLVPQVAAAVNMFDRAAISTAGATPGLYSSSGSDLPAYRLSVDVAL